MPYRITGAEGATPTGVPKQDDNQQSAGGIFSSLNDLATWMIVIIDKGKLNGKQIKMN
jgi:CubicO group peptidase (beta-lactamase class C family)